MARRPAALGAALGVLSAAPLCAWSWGFTVDDALITARVAANISRGIGHRFNATGPVVDAVTPLGFEYLLAPFSRGDPWLTMCFAKWIGALAWLAAAAWLGSRIARDGGRPWRFSVLVPLSLCAPLAAWCVSGMETGVIVALATFALSGGRAALPCAGLAAALRPELVPWAIALAAGRAVAASQGSRAVARSIATVVGPPAVVAVVRAVAFGHPVPLSVWAKPSDFGHGAFYVAAALIWTSGPALVLAPLAIARLDRDSRAVLGAAAVHCAALVLAGGDWMALFRLFVPVLPGLFLVGSRLLLVASRPASALRWGAATLAAVVLVLDKGVTARRVGDQRHDLVERARPLLERASRVAALDVGWVGASTRADVVDLAGVTDETIARLPGGHTSKRVPPFLLQQRGVDAVVLLVDGPVPAGDWAGSRWARAVEARVASEVVGLHFVLRGVLELRGTPQSYVVLGLQNGS